MPWNPDNLDFSKCLGTSNGQQQRSDVVDEKVVPDVTPTKKKRLITNCFAS